ncbi:anamorsin homolog 2 isoform X2 [Amborella trichopoda]|uniref:anamorsin homolog 2 isoform X2 n=1 Tax=Amborella trichopoda TaxID=13333 RepID=UPI0009BFDB2F|nr:anamorsin homolog 2 isoform X2 [Amborella trichopoda]|eukprot:XP_020528197.1 anamorsin homolog 2 isoform X2 [Amborella trichopoda]
MEMDFQGGVLIITDSISMNAGIVVWALEHFSVGPKDLRIITQASLLEGHLYFNSTLSAVVSITEKPGFHTQLWLLELAKVLKPGGTVYLQEPSFFEGNKEIVKAKRPSWDICSSSFPLQKKTPLKRGSTIVTFPSTFQPQIDETLEDLIEDEKFCSSEDLKKLQLPVDDNMLLKERIRERNRLYQRRRRARMTEEQRKRERERRRQYMQSRRVQPITFETPQAIAYERSKDYEQIVHCRQLIREAHGIEVEKNSSVGEAGEAS